MLNYLIRLSAMFKIRHLARVIELLLSGGLLVLVIVFAETRQAGRTCQNITVTIAREEEQRFVGKQDVHAQLTAHTAPPILGASIRSINSRRLEDIVKTNIFVQQGVVYKNWQGVLKIVIIPRRPIARIIASDQQRRYIDEEGVLLPLSDRYTARVLLVDVALLQGVKTNLKECSYSASLLALLNYIDRNPFWRAQIAYMRIDEKGKITMRTQIGKQRIELGRPEAIERKLAKLVLFYKQVIPYKGWNTYRRVNIEFDNQIVCE